MSKENTASVTMNRAKPYQLVLFPFNNGATNVYYILTSSYIAYYGGVLGLLTVFAGTMVTVMRLFDAVTDPVIGALIDKTNGKFGKFRPFMVLGNVIMAVSSILLYFCTQLVPTSMMPMRYVLYVFFYAIYVIGYTFQTSVTRSGQTVLTNDPKQRPMFTIFNLVASMLGMGAIQFCAPIIRANFGDYTTQSFFNVLIPAAIIVSAGLTVLGLTYSPIRGPEGNIEYLMWLEKREEIPMEILDMSEKEAIDALLALTMAGEGLSRNEEQTRQVEELVEEAHGALDEAK